MSLDRTLALVTAACLTLTIALSALFVINGGQEQLSEGKRQEMQATALLLTSSMSQAASLSATQATQISRDVRVIELLRAGDRAALAAYLKPSYDALASEAGVNMLHFHTPDIKSFLRVQDPTNFGQDLSGFRPMILAANKTRLLQKGLEVGIAGLSLRAVSPVLDGETLIGTFEVGVDLKTLMDLAKSASGADFALFLSPSITGFTPKDKQAVAGTNGLVIEAATETRLFEELAGVGAVGLQREPIEATVSVKDRNFSTLSQPLLDYSGRMIGTIVIARDITELGNAFYRALVTAAAVCAIGFILCFGLMMVALRAMVVKPLGDLARYGASLLGETSATVERPTSGLVELQEAAEAMGKVADRAQMARDRAQ